MHCTEEQKNKSGMTLVEIMVSLSIFGFMAIGVWSSVWLHGKSFLYNRVSNGNVLSASQVVNRLVYGDGTYWGVRSGSESQTLVTTTGVTGTEGQLGWQAVVPHEMDMPDMPATFANHPQMTIVYNPLSEQISINGNVVARRVRDSYCRMDGSVMVLGVMVVDERGGQESVMETRIQLRNP